MANRVGSSKFIVNICKDSDIHNHYLFPPPPTGVDDFENLSTDNEFLLTMAWHSAYNPNGLFYGKGPQGSIAAECNKYKQVYDDLPVADDTRHIGLAFNPATIRSVHQLHIHSVCAQCFSPETFVFP